MVRDGTAALDGLTLTYGAGQFDKDLFVNAYAGRRHLLQGQLAHCATL